MNANQAIEYILSKTNVKLTYSRLAEILGIAKQNISRYKNSDLPERHIKAIETYFKLSLSEPVTNCLYSDNPVVVVKLKKGQILQVQYED